ncbi:MAG: nucleotidyltransferase domain-containing protein, partial [Nanoarchaeota archaeon]
MLSKSLRKILEFQSKKLFYDHRSEIIDIFLFGSIIKGKKNPRDIDILIIFKDKKNLQLAYEFRKTLEKSLLLIVEVTSKTYCEIFEKNFQARESILTEGYSLLHKISFAEGLGYKPIIMFHYNLQGKTKSERMRFYYSLYGRGTAGMLKKLKAIKYANTV